MSRLCSQLSETAPTWGRLVAPWAEYVARALWSTASRTESLATRLTQQHRREAKGSSPLPPPVPTPRRENICRGCGKSIRSERTHCGRCAIDSATQRIISAAEIGRQASKSPEAPAKQRVNRRRTHRHARRGIRRLNLLGSRVISTPRRSNLGLQQSPVARSPEGLAYHAGMPAASGKGIDRTHGTGGGWQRWLEFQTRDRAKAGASANGCPQTIESTHSKKKASTK